MNKKSWQTKAITICYFGLYIATALSFLIRQPFGSPPDEFNRYLIPQYIAENGALPNGYDEAIRIPGYGFSYGFQPILPYIFQGLAMRLTGLFTDSADALVYTARSVNFLFGLLMAFYVLLLSRKWFQSECWQWLFAFLVTFLPQSVFIHTYVNTDSCCMLSTALMLYGLTCGVQDGFQIRSSFTMAAGIILCALSYYNAYGFILSCILVFTAYFAAPVSQKAPFDLKQFLKKGSLIAGCVLAGTAWWFIRSAVLYDGDFLGLKARERCATLYAEAALHPELRITWQNQGHSAAEMLFHSDFLQLSQLSFIGIFGSMNIPTSIWVYRFYRLLFFSGVFLCVILVPGLFLPKKWIGDQRRIFVLEENRKWLEYFFHGNMIFCILMPFFLSVRYSYTTDFQPQGRYLLPALIPLAFYCVRGLEKGWRKCGRQKRSGRPAAEGITAALILCGITVSLLVSLYGYVFGYYNG